MLIWPPLRARFERWLFAPAAAPAVAWATARTRVRRMAQYPYALMRDLLGGQLSIHAMGLVYATLLALVPLVAFSFAILKAFGAHRDLEPVIFEFFRPMGGAATDLTQRVMDFADHVRGGLVGSVGLGLLIWTLIGALKKVEDSLNFVWHVELARSFMRRIAEYAALLVVAPVLAGALISMVEMTGANRSVQRIEHLPLLGSLSHGLLTAAPVALISAVFALVYALIPNTRVRPFPAIIGGLAAGILWATVGRYFTAFVLLSTRLTVVYAGFALFIAALIWIYLSWLILLLGAQLSFYVQNPSYLRVGLREPRLSNIETEQLALSIMYWVARSHLRGDGYLGVNAIAAQLALPGVAVTRMADTLEAAGLLVTTEQDTLLPGRDAGRISLLEILTVARAAHSVHGDELPIAPPAVLRVCAEFADAWRARASAMDLESLVSEIR